MADSNTILPAELQHLALKQPEKKADEGALSTLHKITILSLLILHSDKFYDSFIDILPLETEYSKPDDRWIRDNFLVPYQQFLLKCCTSSEMYSKLKTKRTVVHEHFLNFDTVFYLINLLNKLFPAVDKISQLGRYY